MTSSNDVITTKYTNFVVMTSLDDVMTKKLIFSVTIFLNFNSLCSVRHGSQPRGESSTPSSCRWRPWRWIGVQVRQGRSLYNGRCPVGDWLWCPTLKCGLPKKDHGWSWDPGVWMTKLPQEDCWECSSHSNSWVSLSTMIFLGQTTFQNWPPKPSRQLDIRHSTKSFLGTPEPRSIYKTFICSLMEYCSPLWAGSPASHLSQLYAVETKAFKIIGISAMKPGPWASHFPIIDNSVVSLFHRLLFGLASSALSVLCPRGFCRAHMVHHLPFDETPKIQNNCPPPLLCSSFFCSLLFPTCGMNFHILFNLIIPSRSSRQLFLTISDHPPSKTIFFNHLSKFPSWEFVSVSILFTTCSIPNLPFLPTLSKSSSI